jgi:hypothetical protein
MTESSRTQRASKVREDEQRELEVRQWVPPSLIPEIPEQFKDPNYTYRWVRVYNNGEIDNKNVSSKMREGYEPVKAEEVPSMRFHTVTQGPFEGAIEMGGLLLCKLHKSLAAQRRTYYKNRNRMATESVNANLEAQRDPRIPLFNNQKDELSFGTGN